MNAQAKIDDTEMKESEYLFYSAIDALVLHGYPRPTAVNIVAEHREWQRRNRQRVTDYTSFANAAYARGYKAQGDRFLASQTQEF